MSILTKAFVVLVTVLSIVLVALVVPFIATQQNFQEQVKDKDAQIAQLKSAALSAERELLIAMKDEGTRNALLEQQNNQLVADLEQQKTAAKLAEDRAKVAEDKLKVQAASLATFSSTMDEQRQMIELLGAQLREAQDNIVALGTQKVQLTDQLNRTTAERDSYNREVRHLREQLVAKDGELAEAVASAAGGGVTTDAVLPPTVPDPPISGQVTAIEVVGPELTLAQINVGETDGVAVGMEFLVSSGPDFKAKIAISRVEPRVSVGQITLAESDIAVGDDVYAGKY